MSINSADAMAQIAWLDTIERLDTLLLEIRHFQCNVIFSLRLPVLYQALRFEECYLWGSYWPNGYEDKSAQPQQAYNWFDLFRNMSSSPIHEFRQLADTWIISFPIIPEKPGKEQENHKKNAPTRAKIANNILETVQYTISSGRWNKDALRHYHNLSVLQILKSNILHDKLVLCHEGYHIFYQYITEPKNANPIEKSLIAQFMIIRSAVAMRLNDYVGRFGDLQAQFDTSLDLSLQEDPTPMINRRHEQGFYTSFMSVRCQQIQDAIDDLLSNLCGTDSVLDKSPQIMHRWRHDFTSTTEHLYDDVGDKNQNGSDKKRRPQINTQFINSSFWMPDRPDLLSSLAHELAHYSIYTRYGDAWSPMLDTKDDKFTRLLKLINHCFDIFQITNRNPAITPIDYSESSLIEISCDLIAASVEGHAYLYALFLELTACSELAYLLEAPIKRFDLDIRPNQYIAIDPDTIGRSWYYRLKLLCTWMKEIYHHPEQDNLINIMIDGIEKIVDSILKYISNLIPSTGENSLKFWKGFTDRLCKISSHSDVAHLAYDWRKARSEYWHKHQNDEGKNSLIYTAPNYSMPLNIDVQNCLFRILLNIKQKPGRLLHSKGEQSINDLTKNFFEKYFTNGKYNEDEFGKFSDHFLCNSEKFILGENSLFFRHIYDIPWRCSILSAIDFLHSDSNASRDSNWLDLFHHQSALGRELYSIALEFYLHQSTATSDRLAITARVVVRLLRDCQYNNEQEKKLKKELEDWLHGSLGFPAGNDGKKLKDDIYNLQSEIEQLVSKSHDNRNLNIKDKQKECLINKYGALTWYSMTEPLTYPTSSWGEKSKLSSAIKFAEKFFGYKTNALLNIVNNNIKTHNDNTDCRLDMIDLLKELKLYIKLWSNKKNNADINREKTVQLLLLSLQTEMSHLEKQQPSSSDLFSQILKNNHFSADTSPFRMVEIERLTAANHIAKISNGFDSQVACALPSLFQLLMSGNWKKPSKTEHLIQITHQTVSTSYFTVLGRFDIISLKYARPMSRPDLPCFRVINYATSMWDEKFIPFFIRREIAVPYRLKYFKDQPHNGLLESANPTQQEKALGFLSILLTGRSSRLSFIARLLYLKNFPTEAETSTNQGLAKVVRLLEDDDCLFLCEGWGDILIVFRGEATISRLDNIFNIQNDIYHDFLVNRTELVLTHHWLNSGIENLTSKYKITSYFRICSDQELRYANTKFIKGINKSVQACGVGEIELLKTPGRSDFAADISPLINNNKYEEFINQLNENISSEVDDVLTIISQKIS
jgi:hypothetical protein